MTEKNYYEISYIRNEVPQIAIIVAWDERDARGWFKDYKPAAEIIEVEEMSYTKFNSGALKGCPILEVPEGWGVPERLEELQTELEELQTELEELTAVSSFTIKDTRFHGHEVSPYGKQNGYVDYRTLAKCFNNVLNNEIYSIGQEMGEGWEYMDGRSINSLWYELDDLSDRVDSFIYDLGEFDDVIEDTIYYDEFKELVSKADNLDEAVQDASNECDAYDADGEVYQWFIVDAWGAELLQDAGELVYYHNELDIYLWGVTHWGTSWDYVLTNIKIEGGDES